MRVCRLPGNRALTQRVIYAQAHKNDPRLTIKHMQKADFGLFFTIKHTRLTIKHMAPAASRVLHRKADSIMEA